MALTQALLLAVLAAAPANKPAPSPATQQMIGTEGAQLLMVRVLGARLDRGWRNAE